MTLEDELLSAYPHDTPVPARLVADAVAASGRVLVVLDDDPTGTQSVSDLPVLTSWELSDFQWAFENRIHGKRAAAVYVLTNSRSLDPAKAAERNREVVENSLIAAREGGVELAFASRSDSTLRGHFPLEPDTIADTAGSLDGCPTDGVVIVPAFPEAGRVTIGGIHYARSAEGTLTPVAETEFARDATFGYKSSSLADYVEEKSGGRYRAADAIVLDLATLRTGTPAESAQAVANALEPAADRTPIIADAVTENDLRRLALGLDEAERRGKRLIYRVGPPFVRGRIGQEVRQPLAGAEAFGAETPTAGALGAQASGAKALDAGALGARALEAGRGSTRGTGEQPGVRTPARGGLVVVGSHVGLTTRQLEALVRRHGALEVVELDVERLLSPHAAESPEHVAEAAHQVAAEHVAEAAHNVATALARGDVVIHTSRTLITAEDPEASLAIARKVSEALVDVVRKTLEATRPHFVVAKGGITSSDVAAHGLGIRRAMVRGPMLPGIVSLWEPMEGPATGIPYVVFAGNVGGDESLADVVEKLSATMKTAQEKEMIHD